MRLGPFIGGLNLYSDAASIADTELTECVNLEVSVDGSLTSRPPILQFQSTAPSSTTAMRILLLAVLNGTTYLIGSSDQGVYYSTGGAWTQLGSTVQSHTAIQYNNKVWFFPKNGTTNGATWDGTTYTVITTLPAGSSAIVYKERAWIVPGLSATSNTARLQFSLVADPGSWNTGDATFIDISPGDGKKLIDITTYQDNIMLFKEDSTYALAFDSVPTSATLKKVNSTIGVSARNCVVQFENSLFVCHRGSVYEIINYQWVKVNVKVPPVFDNSSPASTTYMQNFFITIWGERLIFRWYKKVYAFGLRTRTWSEFQMAGANNEQWFGPLVRWAANGTNGLDTYYGGSCLNEDIRTFKMQNGVDSTTAESTTITCWMRTKNFDSAYGRRYRIFDYGNRFKRMFWWGADVITNSAVTGTATPIVTNFQVTWGMIKTTQWGQLYTWQQPLPAVPSVVTTIASPGILMKHFCKFTEGVRYRQINFKLQLTTDGTTITGPVHVFGIMNVMEVRQIVTEGSN